jgi:hypothetical protein
MLPDPRQKNLKKIPPAQYRKVSYSLRIYPY